MVVGAVRTLDGGPAERVTAQYGTYFADGGGFVQKSVGCMRERNPSTVPLGSLL